MLGVTLQNNVGVPFERIVADTADPCPETPAGNQYLLVLINNFMKWP